MRLCERLWLQHTLCNQLIDIGADARIHISVIRPRGTCANKLVIGQTAAEQSDQELIV